jgi:hypothetical protein
VRATLTCESSERNILRPWRSPDRERRELKRGRRHEQQHREQLSRSDAAGSRCSAMRETRQSATGAASPAAAATRSGRPSSAANGSQVNAPAVTTAYSRAARGAPSRTTSVLLPVAPPPRRHLVRYSGVFGPASKQRAKLRALMPAADRCPTARYQQYGFGGVEDELAVVVTFAPAAVGRAAAPRVRG